MAGISCSFQLIRDDGDLNKEGLKNFSKTTNLSQRGVSYAVVAIMGPQSGGKSTLLNKLFQTDFRMMDAEDGRNQTTQGIWMAKAIGIEPFTIVIDVEGSDSRQRGQDGTTFEKQSALFALAIADIVIINMWCHDIGREQAANRPLLKVVFEVMLRLFRARKTTLLFVIRDQTKTPLEHLERDLRVDIEKIWAKIPKPDDYKGTPLGDFFKVEITALPSYEFKEDKFKAKVDRLRQRFCHSISQGGLAGDRRDVQPASGFDLRAEKIWKTIKQNKDLDLPAMEVLVATYRCDQIAKETLSRLKASLALRKDVESIESILENTLSQYDNEAKHFKESIRDDKRKELEKEAKQVINYAAMLRHLPDNTQFSPRVSTKAKVVRGVALGGVVLGGVALGMVEAVAGAGAVAVAGAPGAVAVAGAVAGAVAVAGVVAVAVAVARAVAGAGAGAGESLDNSDTANGLAGETFDNSPDCENADDLDLEGESADDLAGDDFICENDS